MLCSLECLSNQSKFERFHYTLDSYIGAWLRQVTILGLLILLLFLVQMVMIKLTFIIGASLSMSLDRNNHMDTSDMKGGLILNGSPKKSIPLLSRIGFM